MDKPNIFYTEDGQSHSFSIDDCSADNELIVAGILEKRPIDNKITHLYFYERTNKIRLSVNLGGVKEIKAPEGINHVDCSGVSTLTDLYLPDSVKVLNIIGTSIKELTLPPFMKEIVCYNTVYFKNLDKVLENNPDLDLRMLESTLVNEG